jgi:CHAT domain-containing protein
MIRNLIHFAKLLGTALSIGGWVVLMSVSARSQAQSPEVTALEQGRTLERELAGGQSNSYKLQVESGQFVQLSVYQVGIDVAVQLSKPGGEVWIELDGPNGRYGPEDIAVISDVSGELNVTVRSPNKAAPAGRYKITLVSLREPTDLDRQRAAAEGAFIEAYMKLRPQRTAASRAAAIEKCLQALAFFQTAGDQYRQAWIDHTVALLYAQSGQFRTAFDYASRALPLFRVAKDSLGEASALNYLGGMSDVLGDPQGALVYYSQALAIARASNNSRVTEASVLNNIGKIYNDLADWQKAIDYYNQALVLFRENQDKRNEAIGLHNIGVAYVALGDMQRGLEMLQQALPLRREIGDKAGEADTLTSIGFIYNSMGRSDEALKVYDQAMPLRLTVGDGRAEGITLDHIGIAYASMGQLTRALEFHQQALERHRSAGSARTEASCLGNIGYVYNQLNLPTRALEFYEQASTIFHNFGDGQSEARMLEGIARAKVMLGNLSAARKDIENALNLIERVRSAAGAQLARSSYFASRHAAYELFIDLLMRLHRQNPSAGFDAKALQASERARARSLTEMLNESRVDIRQGVDKALTDRERDLGQMLNAKAQRQIQLRAQKGSEVEIGTLDREISSLEAEYQEVQAAIRSASPAYAGLTQPKTLTLEEMQKQLDPDALLLEYSLGDERSYLWSVSQSGLKSYELPSRKQIQESARSVYGLLTARSAEEQGETAVQRAKRINTADSQLLAAAAELGSLVLAPAKADFGNKRLLVVGDGALQYVPFGALPAPGGGLPGKPGPRTAGNNAIYRPLILDHEIVSLPSMSALAVQRQALANRKPGINAVAVLADPVFSADDVRVKGNIAATAEKVTPANGTDTRILEHISGDVTSKFTIRRLRFTRDEGNQIAAASKQSTNLMALDFKASRDTAMSPELARYRYVHFATHGYLDSERPDLSAIVLSLVDKSGKPEDGFLRTHDIYNLNLPAEVVVLSACQTGLGKDIKGEGLVGLTRGFMYAGARRVVVSLWNVNDKATADLMERFYKGMLQANLSPASALRKAQTELARQPQWRSPYYWAAFVLQGD